MTVEIKLDIDFIRSQYAVFENPESAEWAMFENAGGSYVPRQVVDRLTRFFQFTKVQPYGPFAASIAAGESMEEGYRCAAELVKAGNEEITLGPSTTLNFYVLAQAFRPLLKAGDEIIVTNQDHEANIGCWRRLEEFGAVIKEWQIEPTSGELSVEDLKNLITDRTQLVCFSLCSNIVGTMNPVEDICETAHAAGAFAIGDDVSFAPHRIIDVHHSGLDFYLFSTYKTFGTHVGVMWGQPAVMEKLTGQGHYFNDDKPRYRFNPTGPLHAEIAALAGIGEYTDAVYKHHFKETEPDSHTRAEKVFTLFAEHETRMANRVLDVLREMSGIRIIGQTRAVAGSRAATISFVHSETLSGDIVRQLVDRKIALRNGHFYARRCVEALGIKDADEGVIRISMVHYNSAEEVARLTEGLEDILS